MAAHCDVLVENFKVGDMARYGLDAASLLALNPRLVYCSITGFGQTGPYRDRAGYDYAIQGMGGLMSVTGPSRAEIADDAPGGGPQKVGVAVADLFTGMYAATAILAALRHRDATGQGQAIDMALLDTQVAMLANLGAELPRHRRGAAARRQRAPEHRALPGVRGRRRAHDPRGRQRRPVRHASAPSPAAPSWRATRASPATPTACATATTLVPLLAAMLKRAHARATGSTALEAAKVPCGPINDLADVFADPQVQAPRHDGRRWRIRSPARCAWSRAR